MSRATEEAKSRAEAKIKGKLNDAVLGGIEGNEDAAVDAVAEEGGAVDAIAEEAEEEEAAQGAAGKDGAALDDVPDGTEGAPGADTKKKKKTDLFATIGKFQGDFVAKLKTKLKIVLSVYQIQNALPWLLPSVSYPGVFEGLVNGMSFTVWKSTSVSGDRQFFTKSFLGDDAAVLARSSGEEPALPRHRAGVASMAWRSSRRFSANAP